MASVITELAGKFGLELRNQQAWGNVDGYWFQIAYPAFGRNSFGLSTAIVVPEGKQAMLSDGLAGMAKRIPQLSWQLNGGKLTLERKASIGALKADELSGVILGLTALFREAGASQACAGCNSDRPDGFAMVNGTAMKLCSECQASISSRIAEATQLHTETENRYLRGAVGALVGALVGSIAWVVIGLLGYLAAIGGVAISFCAAKGYTLMKGKVTAIGIVIICVVALAVMVLAQFLTYDLMLYNELQKAGVQVAFSDVLTHTFEVPFMDKELQDAFFRDTLLGVLFLALGSWSVVKSLAVKAKAPAGTFERL